MISNNIANTPLPYWTYNMGVVSCLSVIRGSFAQSWSIGSMKLALCLESRRSACGRLFLCTYIVISIRAIANVLYREVVL